MIDFEKEILGELTPTMIEVKDNLSRDIKANEAAFSIAYNLYTNRHSLLDQNNKKMWDELKQVFNLDESKIYIIKQINGVVGIVEATDDEIKEIKGDKQ